MAYEPTAPDDASFGEHMLTLMVSSLNRIEARLAELSAAEQKAATELERRTKDRGVTFGWEAFSHPLFSVVALIGLYAARWMEVISLSEAVMIFFGVAICQRLEALARRR